MSIKKVHFFILKDKKMHYICNQACSVSKDRVTNDYFKVTCKNCKNILDKQKPTKEQQEKMKKERILKFSKDNLEHKKHVYATYVQAIVKYNIKNVAYSAITSREMLDKSVIRKLESVKDNPQEFMELMFGKPIESEEEKIKIESEYYDKLINHAQNKIENMPHEAKIKIVEDSIENSVAWLRFISEDEKEKNNK